MLKYTLLIVCLVIFPYSSWAITVDDIIRMYDAGMSEEVIYSVIASSLDAPKVTADDIIALKAKGASDKVILAMTKLLQEEKEIKEKEKELTPFDQFFLSPHYSHQYGWPVKNYRNFREVLEQGLYYQSPDFYPDARYVRVYGWHHSFMKKWPYYQISPYSTIIHRKYLPIIPPNGEMDAETLQKILERLEKLEKQQNEKNKDKEK